MQEISEKTITVILPVYNTRKDWLELAINSILEQTYKDFILMIIDDGSDSETKSYLIEKAKEDARIQLEFNESNMGLTKTLNKALKLAKTEWVARMDADDIALPNRLEEQIAVIGEHPDLDFFCSGFVNMTADGRLKDKSNSVSRGGVISPSKILPDLLWFCCYCHPTMMLRRKVILSIGGYPDVRYTEDYALWAKLLFEIKNTKTLLDKRKPVLYYRNVSGKYANIQNDSDIKVKESILSSLGLPTDYARILRVGIDSRCSRFNLKTMLWMLRALREMKRVLLAHPEMDASEINRLIWKSRRRVIKSWIKSGLRIC